MTLTAGVLILVAVTVAQLWLIIKARYPVVRAIEVLTATVPLFLLRTRVVMDAVEGLTEVGGQEGWQPAPCRGGCRYLSLYRELLGRREGCGQD